MSYQPIENYGIIGNMRTVALVGMNGSIDWYCYPHFDSPSIFGAILDDNKGGPFQISPIGDQVRHKQFYWPNARQSLNHKTANSAETASSLELFPRGPAPTGLPDASVEGATSTP
jgi:GH15 family glucan-1,4-alpha-glucosidase